FLDVCLSDKFGGRRKYPQFPHYGFDLSHAWSLLPPMIQDVETGRCQRNARILHCVKSATAFIHMAKIHQQDLITSVADALQYISYYHPQDYITALAEAYEAEQSPAAKDAIAQILTNSRLCAEGRRPICQDTGIVCAFVKIGMDVHWEGVTMSVADMVNEGVRRAYVHPDNKLRASILHDPAGKRINSRDNTPAVIHFDVVPGGTVEVKIAAKGGGSENKAKFTMLNPSDSIVDWVVKTVPTMGA